MMGVVDSALRRSLRLITVSAAVAALVAVASAAAVADDAAAKKVLSGEELYALRCAECHGGRGQGVADKHDEPLYGDRSLADLTKVIHETMPKDAPESEKTSPEDAEKLARYLYESFYTAEARAKSKPPRVELSRLTVRQYQHTVADLLASFREASKLDDRRGLDAQYYNARNMRRDKRAFERTDPKIEFDFGAKSPEEKIGAEEFSMRWQGSVIADETGDYEFCLRTENGARLWVNDQNQALIDAWVASGDEVREHTATVRLLGGRAYPIKVDFFKFKNKSASIALRWKPPHKVWETISVRHLSPMRVQPKLVVTTPFPADDSSVGYARGTSVSKAWDKAATDAALGVASYIETHLDELLGIPRRDERRNVGEGERKGERRNVQEVSAEDRKKRAIELCHRFAERAFRRPLSDEQKRFFVDKRFESAANLEAAVKQVVVLVLKSPRFLYPELRDKPLDDYDVASRLSFGLWDSLPDDELRKAAAEGKLRTPDEVAAQAERMLGDPRAKAKVADFFAEWLQLDEGEEISKDAEHFIGFDDALLADLRTSLELFIEDVVWSEASDYRQLLLADDWFVNRRLAQFYGLEPPALDDAEFQKIPQNPEYRAGVVTHPYLLATLAYHKSTSPIHRGVFATRKLLGRALKPPPMAIQFMDGDFDPHMTMREKVASLTKSDACMSCHSVINPLGFSLEHYDAVGRLRTEDNGRPIDATGEYKTLAGETVRLTGARDLANYAATSAEAHRGFVEQLFQHMVKQASGAFGAETQAQLTDSFAKSEFNIRKLLVEIMKTSALAGIAK